MYKGNASDVAIVSAMRKTDKVSAGTLSALARKGPA
jgi:hypothetical protein